MSHFDLRSPHRCLCEAAEMPDHTITTQHAALDGQLANAPMQAAQVS